VKIRIAGLVLLALTLASCDGDTEQPPGDMKSHSIDEEAWRSDLAAELGHENFDFEELQRIADDECQQTSVDDWVLGLTLTGAEEQADVTRINLRHACPQVLVTYEEAWAEVRDLTISTERLCSTPLDQLDEDERMKAEAIC
jgi:hypothetical protein